MYLKTEGSTPLKIKEYTVYIPPVPKDKSTIINYNLPIKDQRWVRRGLPDFYEERRDEEQYIQDQEQQMVDDGMLKKVMHFDPVLEKYRRDQWRKRIYGVWIMIKGVPTYLTGPHWWYLEWAKSDHSQNNGYPIYYDTQRYRFYFRQYCFEDPFCHGYILIGGRGFGKTTEEICALLENMTKPPHRRQAAIQSKSNDEAKNVIFSEKMVNIYNALPDFWKPESNHGSKPEGKMSFFRETKKGKGSKRVKYGDDKELSIYIYPRVSSVLALDGGTYSDIFNDEIGKTDPKKIADVHKRLEVNVKCVFRNQQKIGLCRLTSTVEEMEKGGKECELIWDESDPAPDKRDGNGFTVSKIYRYFASALETMAQFADDYGIIDQEAAYKYIMNERQPIKDNPSKLASNMRKNPITIEEAFITNAERSMFHPFIITERIKQLQMLSKPPGRVGFLTWRGGVKFSEVLFTDDPSGDFIIYYMPEAKDGLIDTGSTRKILNAVEREHSFDGKMIFKPVNDDLFSAGCDPIKAVRTDDPRASKLAATGFRRFDPMVDENDEDKRAEWKSHNLMWRYLKRSPDPNDDYDNIVKALFFFGHSIMPENNVTDLTKHLRTEGMDAFIIVRRDFDDSVFIKKNQSRSSEDEPVTSTPEAMNAYIRRIQTYVVRHGLRIPDLELLKQLKNFDPQNPTAYDLVISFGYTLLSLDRVFKENFVTIPFENPFAIYDVNGERSSELSKDEEVYLGQYEEEFYNIIDEYVN